MKSLLLLLLFLVKGCFGYRVVCVYTNWSQYRPDGGKFLPEDVDPTLCTHIIYVYAKLKGNKLVPTEWNDEGTTWSEGMFDRVNNLKQLNPELKTLLGVGGWNMGSKNFSKLASGRFSRKIFAKTTAKFLRDRKFDGLSVDWQHPTKRGGKPQDKENFSQLLKEIRKAFDDDSKTSTLPALLLTAGVSASRQVIEDGYEIDNITKYTDFINVMAYDLHGAWDNYTGHPSQLYPRDEEFGPSTELNVDAAMRYWIANVPDRSKLTLGISTYGRTFTLRKPRHNDYNVPTTGPGVAGEFTRQPGMLAYYERCSQYPDARRVWDVSSQVAYWYSGNQWIAGEDIESVKAKVHWMRYNNIGGMMLTSLDMDDFTGMFCTGDYFPLLNTIHKEMRVPLPKNPRLRTQNKPRKVLSGRTRKPTPTTTEAMTTFQTTDYIYDVTFYETTTELTLSTTTPQRAIDHRKQPLTQIADVLIADRRNFEANQSKLKSQQNKSQGTIDTLQYFESLVAPNNEIARNIVQDTVKQELLTTVPPTTKSVAINASQSDVTTINSKKEAVEQTTTSSLQSTIPNQETELRNFLKKAADLPSHSLINGIMKLLGQSSRPTEPASSDISEQNRNPSHLKLQTTTKVVETTTEPPVRIHRNEPNIADLRLGPIINRNNERLFKHEVNQQFIDNNRRNIVSDQNKDSSANFHINRNNMYVAPKQFEKERISMSPSLRRTALVPPPFPLPDMKETRPSKSFLDMKDLGFL